MELSLTWQLGRLALPRRRHQRIKSKQPQ